MKFQKTISLIIMAAMLSSSMPFNVFCSEAAMFVSTAEDSTASGSSLTVSSSNIDVEFNITGQWAGGFNAEINLKNISDTPLEDWHIQMEFPHEITNIWNATIISHDKTLYHISNPGGNNNSTIPVGGNVSFGFSGTYNDDITAPSDISLISSMKSAKESEYSADYTLISDWGSGFTAQITLTNNTDRTIKAWHLAFDFSAEITSIWNGFIEKKENGKYYISNAEYNTEILPGQSIVIGFNGIPDTAHSKPKNFTLTHSDDEFASIPRNVTVNNSDTESDAKIVLDTSELEYEYESENIIYILNKPNELSGKLTGYNNISEFYYEITKRDGTLLIKENMDIKSSWTMNNLEESPQNSIINIVAISFDEIQTTCTINFINDGDLEDTDGDGLINYFEDIVGTDINNKDTDDDGLGDFFEYYIAKTSPLEIDTYKNGISDANEDFDNDSLTNKAEEKLGTFPHVSDSDHDNLNDYDEVYKYRTNPLSCDTDKDDLNDDDEIILGFDPNNADTDNNGIKDSEELVLQTYTADIDCPESPVIKQVKIEMSTCGNLAKNISITPMYNVDIYSTNFVGLVGSPVDITVNSQFDTAKVTFVYDPELVDDIENLGVMWYNENTGFYEDMEAVVDKKSCTITYNTNHFSKYLVCNMTTYHDNINKYQENIKIAYTLYPGNTEWQGQVSLPSEIPGFDETRIKEMSDGKDLYILQATAVYPLNAGGELRHNITAMGHVPLGGVALFSELDNKYAIVDIENDFIMFYSATYGSDYKYSIMSDGTIAKLPDYVDVDKDNIGLENVKKYFVPAENNFHDTDSDKDGLSDFIELFGMLCSNGQIETTNPYNPDTDNDGKPDGEEMGEYDNEKHCYPRYSDPNTKEDNTPTSPKAQTGYDNYIIVCTDGGLTDFLSFKQEEFSYYYDLCIDAPTQVWYAGNVNVFTKIWNEKIGVDISGKPTDIGTVVIIGHGASNESNESQLSFSHKDSSDMVLSAMTFDSQIWGTYMRLPENLSCKKIEKLQMNFCNSGNLFKNKTTKIEKYNIAETFIAANDVNKVIAWDGEIQYYKDFTVGFGNRLTPSCPTNNEKKGCITFIKDSKYIYGKDSANTTVSKKELYELAYPGA